MIQGDGSCVSFAQQVYDELGRTATLCLQVGCSLKIIQGDGSCVSFAQQVMMNGQDCIALLASEELLEDAMA